MADETTAPPATSSHRASEIPLPSAPSRKLLREQADWTQDDTARYCGRHRMSVARWESPSGFEPTGETRRLYAELLADWQRVADQSGAPAAGPLNRTRT